MKFWNTMKAFTIFDFNENYQKWTSQRVHVGRIYLIKYHGYRKTRRNFPDKNSRMKSTKRDIAQKIIYDPMRERERERYIYEIS